MNKTNKKKKQKHFGIIYRIKNRKTGRLIAYTGQVTKDNSTCTDVEKLLREALRSKRYTKQNRDRPIAKYIKENGGIEKFECILVRSYCGDTHKELKDTLNDREEFFIKKYNTYSNTNPNGLNETTGGSTTKEVSKKTRKKQSEKKRGKKLTAEHRKNMLDAQKIALKDPSVRKRISEAQKRANKDPEVRRKKSDWLKKICKDPKERNRRSEVQKKRYEDPKEREIVSEIMKNRWEDPKTRERQSKKMKEALKDPALRKMISDAQKKRWANPKERKKASERMSGEKNHNSKAIICTSPNGTRYRYGSAMDAVRKLEKKYGVKLSISNISLVARGEQSHHCHWTFSYV